MFDMGIIIIVSYLPSFSVECWSCDYTNDDVMFLASFSVECWSCD